MSTDPLRTLVRRFMRNDRKWKYGDAEDALMALARKVEDAALERAATLIECSGFDQSWARGYGVNAHDLIRSLKSKAPPRRGGAP